MNDVFLDLWYGNTAAVAQQGLYQRWVNVLGRVAPVGAVAQLEYRLNAQDWLPLSMGPDYRRLAGHGDFNIELDIADLQPGTNHVTVRATTHANTTVAQDVWLENGTISHAALPVTVEWSHEEVLTRRSQVVDGRWQVADNWLWVQEAGYDRAVAVGSLAHCNYEVRVPVTLYGFSAGGSAPMSGGYGLGIALHWQGHYDWGADAFSSGQPRHGYQPIGGMLWYGWDRRYGFRLRLEGHDASSVLGLDTSGFQMVLGKDYWLCLRGICPPDAPCRYALKAWAIDEPEPDRWQIEGVGVDGELRTGSVLLLAHHTLCRFGMVTITPVAED